MSENRLISKPSQRPQEIDEIISTLKRYDVSVIKDLEDYLLDQYKGDYSDLNSNLALLKLYELGNELSVEREEITIKILIKGLIEFVDQDFALYLHLLPPYVFSTQTSYTTKVQNLTTLYELLISNKFDEFVNKNKELNNIIDEHSLALVRNTFLANKSAKFIISEPVSEDVSALKLSKIISSLI
ncbi:hypothetical protein WICMUC_005038 [Wickerhamomyces mucosus]|uniref:CSN8/PSMD8/EIF3K domain-containing protein n=1 Tax=Wickerhamomyces mucosus TaxID=1378264 RepID=A0A9P8T864_9ASCO|nr:hypothetical protein WICMUC_005038 [Wickerhamomyces mucosus]